MVSEMTYLELIDLICTQGFPRGLVLDHETFASLIPFINTEKIHGDEKEVWVYVVATRVSTYRSLDTNEKHEVKE